MSGRFGPLSLSQFMCNRSKTWITSAFLKAARWCLDFSSDFFLATEFKGLKNPCDATDESSTQVSYFKMNIMYTLLYSTKVLCSLMRIHTINTYEIVSKRWGWGKKKNHNPESRWEEKNELWCACGVLDIYWRETLNLSLSFLAARVKGEIWSSSSIERNLTSFIQ